MLGAVSDQVWQAGGRLGPEGTAVAARIGERIAQARKAAGWTQAQLSQRTHFSVQLVCAVEQGRKPASHGFTPLPRAPCKPIFRGCSIKTGCTASTTLISPARPPSCAPRSTRGTTPTCTPRFTGSTCSPSGSRPGNGCDIGVATSPPCCRTCTPTLPTAPRPPSGANGSLRCWRTHTR